MIEREVVRARNHLQHAADPALVEVIILLDDWLLALDERSKERLLSYFGPLNLPKVALPAAAREGGTA